MTYDAKCPICGKLNNDMYLEETEGEIYLRQMRK